MELKLLKYGATWCPKCKQQDKELLAHPLSIPFELINVDDIEEEIIDSLKIQSIPICRLVKVAEDKSEEEIKRWNGLVKVNEIEEFIKSLPC